MSASLTRSLADARVAIGSEIHARRLARSLRNVAERATSPAEVIEAARATGHGTWGVLALQLTSEFAAFLELAKRDQPQAVLEIGTGIGGTLYGLTWASHPRATIVSIDRRIYPPARRTLYRNFGGRSQEIVAIEANSHLEETRVHVERLFRNQPLDLLFIDGHHAYESVRRDYELYAPLVRTGGLVAFHDIADGPSETVGDVPRFWREVREMLDDPRELSDAPPGGGYGIGVGRRRASVASG
jgi:predicted O-methyltransferase YrrM